MLHLKFESKMRAAEARPGRDSLQALRDGVEDRDRRGGVRGGPSFYPERVVDFFIEHYFGRPRIAELPESLQTSVFDMQVNAGRTR